MLIVCPNCESGYDVKPEMLGATGRKVRCVNCRTEWTAMPSWLPAPSVVPPSEPEVTEQASVPALAAPDFDGQRQAADEMAGVQFAIVPDAPPTPNDDEHDHDEDAPLVIEAAAGAVATIETTAGRLASPRTRRNTAWPRPLPILPTAIVLQLVVIGAILIWRDNVVRILPQTATLFRTIGFTVNLRGLAFSDLHSSQEVQDGVAILVIDGTIRNITGTTVGVPRLRFSLRDASGSELLSWTAPPEQGRLDAGESLPFRSQLASPPAEGRDVSVRFINRLDFANGH